MNIPSENEAIKIVEEFKGDSVRSINRFTTGSHHYVFDVILENGDKLVARLTTPSEKSAMKGAVYWNKFFRQKGVPLPELLTYDLENNFPYMIIERLSGKDLEFVFDNLSEEDLRSLASRIGTFQKIAKDTVKSELFGFSIYSETAPFTTWREVVEASLTRSRERIEATGIISNEYCKMTEDFVLSFKELDKKESVAFFHDLTSKNVIISPNRELSGVVDVDDLCFGDPTYHLALTKVALSGRANCDKYIKFLLESYNEYDANLMDVYLAVFYLDFLSEIGQNFNGNVVAASQERICFLKNELKKCIS